MLKKTRKMIADVLKKELQTFKEVESTILFGSYARGDMDGRSDIDLCIVLPHKNKELERKISEKILNLEEQLDKNIQVVFTDSNFTGQDRNFVENILREGKVITGKMPMLSIRRLQLEPYLIIKYDLSKLNQAEKMKVNRLLYGKKTSKKYKTKTYISQKKGIVEKTKSERIGLASILVPQNKIRILEEILHEHRVPYKKIPAWIQKT